MTSASSVPFHQSADQALIERLLAAVAEREGTSTVSLDEPLYEAIDSDALNALLLSTGRSVAVEFNYLGYRIEVHGNDRIEVTDSDEGATD